MIAGLAVPEQAALARRSRRAARVRRSSQGLRQKRSAVLRRDLVGGDGLAAKDRLEELTNLIDLFSSHASVLEHNVSGQVAARFKHAALANVTALARQMRLYLPELGDQAWQVCAQLGFAMSAIWVHSRPSAGVLAAAEVDPSLVEFRIDFERALESMLATLISGTLARR